MRSIYANRIVSFLLSHQLAVVNVAFCSAGAGMIIFSLQVLGHSVPRVLIFLVYACSIVAFITFCTTIILLKPKPQVLATIKIEQLSNALPAIRGVYGMALRQQLNHFMGKCLHHHQMNDGLDGEFYISALLHKAGDKSAIGLALTTVSRTTAINGIEPLEFYLHRAKSKRVVWERTHGALDETETDRKLRQMLDALDVRFEPDLATQQTLEYWSDVLANQGHALARDRAFG
jgi:hypothetical protein